MNSAQIPSLSGSDRSRLGVLQGTFQAKGTIKTIMLGTGIFLILGALCWLSFLPSILDEGDGRGVSMLVGMALVFFVGGVLSLGVYYVHKQRRVEVYENGLVISTWRERITFLWDAIENIEREPVYIFRNKMTPAGVRKEKVLLDMRYILTGHDGRIAKIQSVKDAAILGRTIEKFVEASRASGEHLSGLAHATGKNPQSHGKHG